MRIIQIIPGADSFRVFLPELTQALIDEGHEVLTLLNPKGIFSNQSIDGPGKICKIKFPRGVNPCSHVISGLKVRSVIKAFKPDVVHAHFSAAIMTTAIARLGGTCGACWISTFQGLQFPFVSGFKGKLIRSAEVFSASRMNHVIVLTEDDRLALLNKIQNKNIHRQSSPGFGCHDRFFDTALPTAEERIVIRTALDIRAHDRVFIFIGRMVSHKGFHLTARAFMQAAEKHPDLHWIVIGERDPIHPTGLNLNEWESFEKHPQISFMGFQDDVLPFLDASDAMLFPTSREGMPVSVMESLARRVPVLTNRVRGCRELIQEGMNGIFFETSSVEAIRSAIETFQVFPQPIPSETMRRSHWIRETINLYENKSKAAES